MLTNVWKMPLKSQRQPDFILDKGHPDKFETNKTSRARKFCFDEGWTGIGWGLPNIFSRLSDAEKYLASLNAIPKNELPFPFIDASGSCKALAFDMKIGDFVWCRTDKNSYYVGRVCGPWEYHFEGKFADFDLYQVRKCDWHFAGPSDLIPGRIKNAFAGPGMAISRMKTESDAALFASELIWEIKTGEAPSRQNWLGDSILPVVGHDELEDIVGLYLQMELGWYIVPTTAKFATPHTEFVLRNRAGQRAYLQVKSGKKKVEFPTLELSEDIDNFFVFYPTLSDSEVVGLNTKIKAIKPQAIEEFIRLNRVLLPKFVQLLSNSRTTHPPSALR